MKKKLKPKAPATPAKMRSAGGESACDPKEIHSTLKWRFTQAKATAEQHAKNNRKAR